MVSQFALKSQRRRQLSDMEAQRTVEPLALFVFLVEALLR